MGASFIKTVENLRSAATGHTFSIDHGRNGHTNGREWGVFDYRIDMFDMFEQVNGAQSTLES